MSFQIQLQLLDIFYSKFHKKKTIPSLSTSQTKNSETNWSWFDSDHVCKKNKGTKSEIIDKNWTFFSLDGTCGTKINRVTRVRAWRPSVYTIPGRVPRIMNNLTRSWSAMQYKIDFMDSGCKCVRARARSYCHPRVLIKRRATIIDSAWLNKESVLPVNDPDWLLDRLYDP